MSLNKPSSVTSSVTPCSVSENAAYDDLKTGRKRHTWEATWKALIAGLSAGAVSRTVTAPLERLKIMQQTQAHNPGIKALRWQSLFRGNGMNVLRIGPYSALQYGFFDFYQHHIKSWSVGTSSIVQNFASGACAGLTASTLVYPLDLMRTRMTVNVLSSHMTLSECGKTLYQQGGVLGFYKGITATWPGIMLYLGCNFAIFNHVRTWFEPLNVDSHLKNAISGATAGGLALMMTYPTDVHRHLMQMQGETVGGVKVPRYGSLWECIRTIQAKDGFRGHYKGLSWALLKIVPSAATSYTVYEWMVKTLGVDRSLHFKS